jgi:hypothetical protein
VTSVDRPNVPSGEAKTVFTMTIRSAGRTVITSGESRAGEEWEDTLGRLYREALPAHEPPRRVVFRHYRSYEVSTSTNMVITGSGDAAGREKRDPPVFITTEPPQF